MVPLARVPRVIHVMPELAQLMERKNFGASPAALDSPLAERPALHYFWNDSYPWDV